MGNLFVSQEATQNFLHFLSFLKEPIKVVKSGNFNDIIRSLLPAIALVIVMAAGLRVALSRTAGPPEDTRATSLVEVRFSPKMSTVRRWPR